MISRRAALTTFLATNDHLRQVFRPLLLLVLGLLAPVVIAQPIWEYPPSLPPSFFNMPLNGGRVQSIAVSPTDSEHVIAAHEFGGLWRTTDGGHRWFHLNGLQEVWVRDVAYGADGRTVIATVEPDLRSENGGGIWVSRDEGATWRKPATGNVPTTVSGFSRTGAFGISYAPDAPERIYVGTYYGIAISIDNGEHWSHHLLGNNGLEARSVQALPGNRAIAANTAQIYLKSAADDTWVVIRDGRFADGFKSIDLSPYDNDKVFILLDYNTLFLYEVATGRRTDIPLPGGASRSPFVRVGRGDVPPPAIDLWVGLGINAYKASCADIECVRRLRCTRRPELPPESCDWQVLLGLHADTGHLGLSAAGRPVFLGTDGGLFRPLDREATHWTPGSRGGSGMNSYQMTSLSGTNYNTTGRPSLYFATQDNGIWGSPDGGRTWPTADGAEGWKIQTWHQATSTSDPATRVAYGTTGTWTGPRISDANLLNGRDATNVPVPGQRRIRGRLSESFLLSPGNWIRIIDGRSSGSDRLSFSVSTDNLDHWRQQVLTTRLNPAGTGIFFTSGGALATPSTYAAFQGEGTDPSGDPLIALASMPDVLHADPGEITDLRYLPNGGSLGVLETAFDWHAVYGVDPRNPEFLIAPDVVHGIVWKSHTGGLGWETDEPLTNVVTHSDPVTGVRSLLLYDGRPGQVQITNIAFSPYDPDLIMVGTREAGVIYSEDRGTSWQTVPDSEAMLYISGFFFSPNGTVYVSTYGRGLWKIDMGWRRQRFPAEDLLCPGDCGIVRIPPDPKEGKEFRDFPWKEHNVVVVFGGRVNGLTLSGKEVKSITVTPGSSYMFYAVDDQVKPEISESKEGAGFHDDLVAEFAVTNQEVITGVIFKAGQLVGYLTNKVEFEAKKKLVAPKAGKEIPADKPGSGLPYLSISTGSPLGSGLVQTGGVIRFFASGFVRGTPVEVRLDGEKLAEVNVEKNERLSYIIKVDEKLSVGQHRLEGIQKTLKGDRKAVATFIKVRGGDRVAKQPE